MIYMDIKNIYWLAGLLEGEGYFASRKSKDVYYCPVISIQMTDSDIIYRAKSIMGGTASVTSYIPSNEKYKVKYTYSIQGDLAIQWMMTLYPLLGDRRKAKVKEVILSWKNYQRGNRSNHSEYCLKGHHISGENMYLYTKDGREYRSCRTCRSHYNKTYSDKFPSIDEELFNLENRVNAIVESKKCRIQ